MLYHELCELYNELEKNPSRLKKTEILANFLKKVKKSGEGDILYLLQGKVFADYSEKELGISEQLVIKALAKSCGMSAESIILQWKKVGDLGIVAEQQIVRKKQNTLFSSRLSTEKVLENLRRLPLTEGSGAIEKKMAYICELLSSADGLEAKYIVRTLLADLRIGVAAGTLRDAIARSFFGDEDEEKIKDAIILIQEAYDICNDWKYVFETAASGLAALEKTTLSPGKPVKVMLFLKESTIEDGFSRVGKPALLDYKYDGFRMLITKNDTGEISLFTRRLDNVTKQFPEVIEYVQKFVKGKSFILDCEAVGFDPVTKKYRPFQEISQRIKRKYGIVAMQKELPIEVNVFDILYLNGESLLKKPFCERRKLVEKIINTQPHKIRPSIALITDEQKKAEEFYAQALANGEEGIMMKSLQAPYKPGARVGYGVKIKPIDNEFDLVIVAAEYGTGKRAGWLTSYTVACRDKEKLLEIGKVSTGLKEKESEGLSFIELTNRLKHLIMSEDGREVHVKAELVVTIVYQNIQKSPTYASGYALRFPRITRLRDDRSMKDIATLEEIRKEAREN